MRYIDADKTLKAITSQFDDCVCIADVIYVFDNQPTADVRENVKGEWEYFNVNGAAYDIEGTKTWAVQYRCSKCGFIHNFIENHGKYNYCPNCGADMRTD